MELEKKNSVDDSVSSEDSTSEECPKHNPALGASSRINIDLNEMEKNPKRTKSC